MDYDLDIILIGLVAHQNFEGGTEDSVAAYANDLFNRFNTHIVKAAASAGLDFDARDRSIIACIAAMTPGTTPKESALDAVATYVHLLGNWSRSFKPRVIADRHVHRFGTTTRAVPTR